MLIPYLIAALLLLALTVATAVWWANRRFDGKVKTQVAEMASAAGTDGKETFDPKDLEGLPEPVRRYFRASIPEKHPMIQTVALTQVGRFRMREDSDGWNEMTATEYFTGHPPGFVWDARIAMGPLVSVRVLDTYQKGTGSLNARILGLITVAEGAGETELNKGALMRYLAEAVWFPTALLPNRFLRWDPIDENSAMAVLKDGSNEVGLTFHFSEEGDIVRAAARRYRQEGDNYNLRDWSVAYDRHETRGGVRIPLEGKVIWHLPEGDLAYWEGRVADIAFNSVDGPLALQR